MTQSAEKATPDAHSAKAIADAVRARSLTAVEAVKSALDAIARLDDRLGAFLLVDEQGALDRARQVDERLGRDKDSLPLAGVPVAVKDNICTRNVATTCGSKILAGYRPPYSAHVIDRLQACGAVVIGKTNLDEFGMGSSTENSAVQLTRNPWGLDRVPGGSSGGSAVAVAAGMVPAAIGSDTGGSIRPPASLTGIVGLKPTYGRVSRYGLVAYGSSLDQIGPLTRTAKDAALMLAALAGHDARDSTSVNRGVPDYLAALDRPIAGLRIGVADECFGEGLDGETRAAIERAIDLLRSQGAVVEKVELPHLRYGISAYYLIVTAEASSNLARFDGVHYGHRTPKPADIIDLYSASREEGFGSEVKRRIMLGTYALSSGYYDAYYLRALKVRTLLRREFERAFEKVDLLCSPVSPTTAFPIGEKVDDPLAMYLADVYTNPVNLAGLPGISVPCGHDAKGLPIGMQLIGPAFSEEVLLAAAHQYQQLTDHHRKRPTW